MNLLERVYQYSVNVVEGNIVAGKKHRQAAARFLNDLERSIYDKDCYFYFDNDELEEFNEWASLFKHTKGVIAGQHIQLTDFQLFLAANIICFKKKENNYRKISSVYIQLARKNAKSQFLAILSSYIAFLSDQVEEVYISGWMKEQSDIVYQEILKQLERVPSFAGKYKTSYNRIHHLKSGSIIRALSREARQFGEGTNPSLAILDEYHTHLTSEIMESLEEGMGARANSLSVIITTAGRNLNAPCKAEYDYCSKVVDPDNPVDNDSYFVAICELDEGDDPFDESLWMKANPIAATYPEGMESIRKRAKKAKDAADAMPSYLTKRMNIWVSAQEKGYLDLDKWSTCLWEAPIDITNRKVYLGLDLATKQDLCSLGIVIPLGNGRFYVDSHSFIPNESLESRIQSDRAPFRQWLREGLLTMTDGAVTDYSYIIDHIEKIVRDNKWKVLEIGYDPHDATYLSQEMSEKGYTMVEVKQNIATQHEPLTEFQEKVLKKEAVHSGNGLLTWSIGNAITVNNSDDRIKLSKAKSTERIDPIASVINAFSRAMHGNETIDYNKMFLSKGFSF
ncbi:terminase large subunit [Shouchella lehensis]|uniref:Terminase large subunit n=1 Tax=Shouchella lehensis G1 TaxID=1246626 RepID=A0A060M0A3_9BACI|nr:terminase TerL endonuclease subunit [Shouchella lehensis]AIC95450.1 terminase large subunit [Shouchella lehensis G1]